MIIVGFCRRTFNFKKLDIESNTQVVDNSHSGTVVL